MLTKAQKLAVICDRLGYDRATAEAFLAKQAEKRRMLLSMSPEDRRAYLAKEAEQQAKRAEKFRADRKKRLRAEAKAAKLKPKVIEGEFTVIDEKDKSK